MSETSYSTVAPAPVRSFADIPLDLGIKLGFIKDNHLKFDDEHCKIIYDQCLDHVTTCQLSSRCLRVFNAILRQTIGFGKLEDNSTTTRLEQLTKIRHDHAGKVIRYLSKRNIIKWRKGGKYNNYLSINFDFASWGERDPNKQKPNNDPTGLLPEYYRNAPIDQGIRFDDDDDLSEVKDTDCTISTPIAEHQTVQQTKNNNNQSVTSTSESINSLDNKTLKALIIDTVTDLFAKETPQIDIEKYTQIKEQVEQQNQVLAQNQADKKILEQQLVARHHYEQTQQKTIQDYQQQIAHLKQQKASLYVDNNLVENHSNDTVTSHQFTYPKTLSDAERQALQPLLKKLDEPEIAQKILDLLKIRLTNTQKPLNSTVAYFAGLVKRHQRGELDFSALKTVKEPMDAAVISAIKMGLRNLVGELREHDIKILHYQRMLKDAEVTKDKSEYNQAAYDNYLYALTEHEDKAKSTYYAIVNYVEEHSQIVDTSILEKL